MNLSYDEIRRIYRLEKTTSRLVDVESDFYNSLFDFVRAERDKYLKSLESFSLEEARDFANLKKMVETIFLFRQKKILSLALVSSRGNSEIEEKIAAQEQKLYSNVLSALSEQRSLLDSMFGDPTKKSGAVRSSDLNTLSIKILKEVPAFIGTDMQEYGPFAEGAVVSLPNKVAKLFLDRKLGERTEK